jgi:hypothetical protein
MAFARECQVERERVKRPFAVIQLDLTHRSSDFSEDGHPHT